MPTVLCGKGKLSIVCFLLRYTYSQGKRGQSNFCTRGILEDMTQSWQSQQALGGDQAQRIIYNSKDARHSAVQQRQSRGDPQQRMARHPYVAPHKSMLADDLKVSSDEDDSQRVIHESASWERHSLAAQRAYTHSRRVRHSSSDSSDSDSSAESSRSSLHSRSLSPELHPEPSSPAATQPLCNNKEIDHRSATQWQLDKWLERSKKRSARTDQDFSQTTEEPQVSPISQRAPSPARSWDSNQEYSPSQTPIPSPRFSYSQNNSPVPSPGYSFCPSPSPFPSTCPSPSPSPQHSPPPSPVQSICPSPCGTPRTSRSPSPIPRHPPKSPSPSLPAPSSFDYLEDQSQKHSHPVLTSTPYRTKIRPWIPPLPTSSSKSKPTSHKHPEALYHHKPKNHSTHSQVQSQRKSQGSVILKSQPNLNQKPTPKPTSFSRTKELSDTHKNKKSTLLDQTQSSQYKSKPHPQFQQPSSHSPKRSKHLVPTGRETSTDPGTHSQSTCNTTSISVTKSSTGPFPNLIQWTKLWKPAEPKLTHVSHTKTSQRKLPSKEREVDQRTSHLSQTEGRIQERKEDRPHLEKQQGKVERKEDRRLAEEQLLRRRIQSSAEEEEEEEDRATEHEGVKRDKERGKHRRKVEHAKEEWKTVKQRVPPNHKQHLPREGSDCQGRPKKGRRCDEDREVPKDLSPVLSTHSSTPQIRSFKSSSSSSSTTPYNSDSESESLVSVAKVSDDFNSHRRVPKTGDQASSRPDTTKPKTVYPRRASSGNSCEGQQSEAKQRLYTLVPFGRGEKTPSTAQRGLRNLVVQIDLCLLKRVPESPTNPNPKKSSPSISAPSNKEKPKESMKHIYDHETSTKDCKRKRKLDNGITQKETKRSLLYPSEAPGQKEPSSLATENIVTETVHNGYLEEYLDNKRPVSPLSPLSPLPQSPEPAKPPAKAKTTTEQQQSRSQKTKDKNRDVAVKPKMEVESVKVSRQPQPQAPSESTWGPTGHRGTVPNKEISHHAEYYLHEAKRMKHRADAMVDKLGKAVNYIDAALSFMECGKAMEEGPLEAKSPFTMYSETVELIRYAMRLKSHSGPGARQEDKQLAVLCFRCLALLYWQMFRLKKDHALKYSKVLLDYFKSSPKVPTTPPGWMDSGKATTGLLSSQSPPAKHHRRGSTAGSSTASLISIPQRIHQMAANHLNITNSVLYSYEYWEVADNLAMENKEFFNYLNTLSGPLTLHSSIAHAVQYTRQALQWIRISAKLN
ncbi:PREDICTED: AF4/FMR2 family member 3-like isoform X1 [Cyprinodon variegatus]|uniref:AF4/FMR2 family member 3-like isoform X1 n=1 Tax=Cyprinodon variegatus TaxID=28743 RepID=UPI000742BD98|nr:PREDICTED: AF4/FMR2 family member 3-like isoform X1 [Cyprinodon variegatus]